MHVREPWPGDLLELRWHSFCAWSLWNPNFLLHVYIFWSIPCLCHWGTISSNGVRKIPRSINCELLCSVGAASRPVWARVSCTIGAGAATRVYFSTQCLFASSGPFWWALCRPQHFPAKFQPCDLVDGCGYRTLRQQILGVQLLKGK